QCRVVAAVAVDRVVAVAADQRLDAAPAGERVVSGASVEDEGDRLGREGSCRNAVPAVESADVEQVGRILVPDRHLRRQAGYRDTGGVSGDVDGVVAVGAVDGHAVGLAVAGGAAERAGEVDIHSADVGSGEVV